MAGIKNNRRTVLTKESIKNSFLQLLATKALSQITVTEICHRADINRGTFYLHYKDVYHLFDVLREEMVDELREKVVVKQDLCSEKGAVLQLLQIIYERKTIYQAMMQQSKESNLLTGIFKEFRTIFFQRIKADLGERTIPVTASDYYFTYMIYGCTGIINEWLKSEQQASPEQISQIITELSETTIRLTEGQKSI
ncbi:TetR-like C-terminal domain-containing protein [Paenibacillus yanchengensis]|uniref:TetR-like C-terminal domain-containing protein n=1 Tax=Paenibacillus yanchengensis TaxID=2035833 RepID=A0ABW4YNB8_9BACL